MDGEDGDLAQMILGAVGDGEGGIGFGEICFGGAVMVLLVDQADGEEIVFDGAEAVEAPSGVGQRLNEVGLGGALGVVLIVEGAGVLEVRDAVFGGQYDDLPGEAMAEGVEGRFLFPGFGFGSGGLGGVLAIGGVAAFRHA